MRGTNTGAFGELCPSGPHDRGSVRRREATGRRVRSASSAPLPAAAAARAVSFCKVLMFRHPDGLVEDWGDESDCAEPFSIVLSEVME